MDNGEQMKDIKNNPCKPLKFNIHSNYETNLQESKAIRYKKAQRGCQTEFKT